MRLHHAAGCRRDAEIAVFGVSAQAGVEILVAMMADGELVLGTILGPRLDARLSFHFRLAPLDFLAAFRLAFFLALAIDASLILPDWITMAEAMEEPKPQAIRIFVDADACPVKAEVYRVAERYGLKVFVVANSFMNVPRSDMIERVIVKEGPDVADDWIVERAGLSDIVITADIPLAGRCVKKGATAIGPTGKPFNDDSIGMALATRDLLTDSAQRRRQHARSAAADASGYLAISIGARSGSSEAEKKISGTALTPFIPAKAESRAMVCKVRSSRPWVPAVAGRAEILLRRFGRPAMRLRPAGWVADEFLDLGQHLGLKCAHRFGDIEHVAPGGERVQSDAEITEDILGPADRCRRRRSRSSGRIFRRPRAAP